MFNFVADGRNLGPCQQRNGQQVRQEHSARDAPSLRQNGRNYFEDSELKFRNGNVSKHSVKNPGRGVTTFCVFAFLLTS